MSGPVEVTEMWSADEWDVSSEDGLRVRVGIRNGYEITAPADYTEDQISTLPGIPQTGETLAGYPTIFVRSRKFKRVGPCFWRAFISFGGEYGPLGPASHPELNPPIIRWYNETTVEEIDEDYFGNPIVTANGEPMRTTTSLNDMVCNIRRDYFTFSPHLTYQYLRSRNSADFLSFPRGTGRMTGFIAEQQWDEGNNGYWTVDTTIKFRYPVPGVSTAEDVWDARLRHEGFYEKVDSTGPADMNGNIPTAIVHAVDDNKRKVVRPVLLDTEGRRETNPDNAVWLTFPRHGFLDFNDLGLVT